MILCPPQNNKTFIEHIFPFIFYILRDISTQKLKWVTLYKKFNSIRNTTSSLNTQISIQNAILHKN